MIGVVHEWCARLGYDISSADGQKALEAASALSKSAANDRPDLFTALSQDIAALRQPSAVACVLIVEDEPLIALDMEQTLETSGIKAKICISCALAREWLASKTPAVAVLDFHLKDGSCTEIAELLRQRGVPIVICSGADRSEISSTLGEIAWLSKPSDPRQLTGIVRQAMDFHGFRQQLERQA